MKKFLLSLVGLFVAFAANAVDYYLIGGPIGWNLKAEAGKFTAQGDGTYVLDYVGTLTSGFKINDGTWSNDEMNFGGSAILKLGEVYNLTAAGISGNIPLENPIENPHLVFNPTAKTLLITGQQAESVITYAIHGSIFGGTDWITKDMTEDNGKWVLPEMEVKDGSFGIKKMDNGAQIGWINLPTGSTAKLNEAYTVAVDGGTNIEIKEGKYSFTFDPDAMTLLVAGEESQGGGDEPDDNDYLELYLRGEMTGTGWPAVDEYKMSTTDGKTYTLEVAGMSTGEFKFATANWSKSYTIDKDDLGNGTYTFTDIYGRNTNLKKGGDVKFTLVLSDDKTSAEVTIEGQEADPSDVFKKVYLWSSRNGFKVSEKLRFATDDGQTYTLNLPDAGSDIAFKFMVMMGEDDDTDSYRYFSNGMQNMCNDTYTITGDVTRNMTLHTGGNVTYTIKPAADFSSIEVTIEGQEHDSDPYPPIYLVGDMTNWETKEAYRLDTTNGTTYTITKEMSADDEFQFVGTDAHNHWFSNSDMQMVAGEGYELKVDLGEGKNMSLVKSGKVTFTFTLGELHADATLDVAYIGDPIEETHELSYILRGTTSQAENATWTDFKMTEQDGKWSFIAPEALVKFGIAEWCSTHEKEKRWISSADEDSAIAEAGTYGCKAVANNWSSTLEGKTTYTFDPEAMTLTIANEGVVNPPVPSATKYYLVGGEYGWVAPNDYEFSKGENDVYTLNLDELKGSFKIVDDKNTWYGKGENAIELGTPYACVEGGADNNFSFEAVVKNAKLVFNSTNNTLTVTGTVEQGGEDDPTDAVYYLTGDFNNWTNPDENAKFTKQADGSYTLDVDKIIGSIKVTDGTWEGNFGGTDEKLEIGVPYECAPNAGMNNIILANGIENAHVVFAPDSKTLTITGDKYQPEVAYVLRGTIKTGDDAEWKDYPMENASGKWTVTLDQPLAEFGIKEVEKDVYEATPDDETKLNWIASGDGKKIEENNDYAAKVSGSNWTSTVTGKPTYIFDPEAMILTVSGATGISAIEAEEGDAVYFNLQGQRVANPDKGIYIRVVNGKAVKVVK
ncbi:MAG: hypothetical protein K2H46_09685 [Muribaculaceae bacterium]|nr:hypothetical protein [Muribaculaceae bacterium]